MRIPFFKLVIFLLLLRSASAEDSSGAPSLAGNGSTGTPTLTSEDCTKRGGRIVNKMGGDGCSTSETLVSVVTGMRCECICCASIEQKHGESEKISEDMFQLEKQLRNGKIHEIPWSRGSNPKH